MVIHPAIQPMFCVIGHPVAGNPMQFALERVLDELHLDWKFLSFNVAPDSLNEAIRGVRALGISGLAVGNPHQTEVLSQMDEASDSATRGGWVDCVEIAEGKLIGMNQLGLTVAGLCLARCSEISEVWVVGNDGRSKAIASEFVSRDISTHHVENFSPESDLSSGSENVAIVTTGSTLPAELVEELLESQSPDASVVMAHLPLQHDALQIEDSRIHQVSGLDILTEGIANYFEHWTEMSASRSTIRDACEEYFEL